jgi:hypothetical protein
MHLYIKIESVHLTVIGFKFSQIVDQAAITKTIQSPGLKISFTRPSDKMSDDFEFGSDMCIMMSDDLQFSLATK